MIYLMGSPKPLLLSQITFGFIKSIAQQTHTGISPNIRRLISHWFLFPRRLSVDSVGHIARSCMLEKQTLRKILEYCDGAYDFMLIENIPCEHRSRARKNGWQNVKGLL